MAAPHCHLRGPFSTIGAGPWRVEGPTGAREAPEAVRRGPTVRLMEEDARTGHAWPDPSRALPELSAVRLEELLHELLERVGEVTAMQERLRALLDAVVGIASDLELPRMLERIVAAACELAGARYGALGVLGSDSKLAEFITYGISPEQRALMGPLPEGHGVLGLLIDEAVPLRMPDITAHPRSHGYPANHPVMHSLVGVPIRIRDRVFGNLYLAEKQGAREFSQDDEDVLSALAAAAGVAIENAALYDISERRMRWLEAGAEISTLLLGDVQRDEALHAVAARARAISEADVAFIALVDESSGDLVIAVVDGAGMDAARGRRLPAAAAGPLNVSHGVGSLVTEAEAAAQASPEAGEVWSALPPGLGPVLVVPLRSAVDVLGVLALGAQTVHRRTFTAQDVQLAESFAAQAALALARAQAQADRELLAVIGDRDRIARDLHDVVIQRLFATGLGLQTAARLTTRPQVRTRVDAAVDDLDAVIRDIRGAIFELHHRADEADLRSALRSLVDEAQHVLDFAPQLRVQGPLETEVTAELRPHLLAVVREALSNAARHAGAGSVRIDVVVHSSEVRLTVADDGVGVGSSTRRSGLENLRRRAEELGGSFSVRAADPRGTVLEWCVPTDG